MPEIENFVDKSNNKIVWQKFNTAVMAYENVLELTKSNYFEAVFNSLVVQTLDHFGRIQNYFR